MVFGADGRHPNELWVNRLGSHFADCIRRDRPGAADKWHPDEVVVPRDAYALEMTA